MKYLKTYENFNKELVLDINDKYGILISEYDVGSCEWHKAIEAAKKYKSEEGWRLPTITELTRIFNSYPYRLKGYGYWSSSDEGKMSDMAWWINSKRGIGFKVKKIHNIIMH